MLMLNLSKLFYTETNENCILSGLELSDEEKAKIKEAQTIIRNALKEHLSTILKNKYNIINGPNPRFYIQGSWAYKTINKPTYDTQQADIDDGCYLPIEFLEESGHKPKEITKVFFDSVEDILHNIKKETWKIINNKETCIRIEISSFAHVDIPLYAIPLNDFNSNLEKRQYKNETTWAILPKDKVLLAKRTGEWVPSDPREIKDWFTNQITEKGEQLRRVVRYLKAARDWHWKTGGPASILLMVIVSDAYEKKDRRDDLAFLNVIRKISEKLKSGVYNPCNKNESLTERLGEKNVQEAANYFDEIADKFEKALNCNNKDDSIQYMRDIFGTRFIFENSNILVSNDNIDNKKTIEPLKSIEDCIRYILRQPHLAPLNYQESIQGTCSITHAVIDTNGYNKKSYKSGDFFPKHVYLNFFAKTDILFPYNVCWRVTNTGEEAKKDGGLRGNPFKIKEIKQEITHRESTKYSGIHAIECFILKDDKIVAKSKPFIVKIPNKDKCQR